MFAAESANAVLLLNRMLRERFAFPGAFTFESNEGLWRRQRWQMKKSAASLGPARRRLERNDDAIVRQSVNWICGPRIEGLERVLECWSGGK